jgi:hypothetical protein
MPETRYTEHYQNGQLVSRTPHEVSDAELEREQLPAHLRAALARCSQIATQADALSQQPAAPTAAQIKALAGAVADLARGVRYLIRHSGIED